MKTTTELRAIARRATTFEAGVQQLLDAGVPNRGRAINLMRSLAPRLYNEFMIKKHPAVEKMQQPRGTTDFTFGPAAKVRIAGL